MSVFRKSMHAFTGMMLMVIASSVNAALVSYTVTGDVTAAGINSFGLQTGDTITATGVINDQAFGYTSNYTSGTLLGGDHTGSILFGAGSSNTMTINVGNKVFSVLNDVNYALGSPTLHFVNGVLNDFSTYYIAGFNGAPAGFGSLFLDFDNDDYAPGGGLNPTAMYGQWNTTVEYSVVPVPAAVWLFGSGLLGLIGFARRK